MTRKPYRRSSSLALACALVVGGCGSSEEAPAESLGGAGSPPASDGAPEADASTEAPAPEAGLDADGAKADTPAPESGPDAAQDAPGEADSALPKDKVGPLEFLGPWAGEVTRLLESPSDPNKLIALASGKLFLSKDGGGAWAAVDSLKDTVYSVILSPDGRLFAGTGTAIVRSSDDGATWQTISTGIEPGLTFGIMPRALGWQPGSPARLWAGLSFYKAAPFWYLDDGSTAWKQWTEPAWWAASPINGKAKFTDLQIRHDTASGKDQLFSTYEFDFSGGGGVVCSRDGMVAFEMCGAGLPASPFHRVHAYDGLVLIAGGHVFGSKWAGVFASTDAASTWTDFTGGWNNPVANDAVRLKNGTFAAGTYDRGLLTAPSLGATWTPVADLDGLEVSSILQHSTGALIAGFAVLGVRKSTDGAKSWQESGKGIAMANLENAAVDPASPTRMIASMSALNSGLVMQTDSGIDGWGIVKSLPHPRFKYVAIGASGRWYVVSDGPTTMGNDGLYVSKDQGASFELLGPLKNQLMDHTIVGLVEEQGGAKLTVAGKYFPNTDPSPFVQVTSDGGQKWTETWKGTKDQTAAHLVSVKTGDMYLSVGGAGGGLLHLPPAGSPELVQPAQWQGGAVDADVCFDDTKTMVGVGITKPNGFETAVLASSDGGGTWTPLAPKLGTGEWVRGLAMHPLDCKIVFAATTASRVMISEDSGGTWKELAGSKALRPLRHVRVVRWNAPGAASLLLVGTGGIWGAGLGMGS
jgi:hypothetical protein